jgi:hypothetical protein
MKVYCKNCKQCKYREFASLGINWGWFCKLKDVKSVDSIGHIVVDFSTSNCEKLNLSFDCSNYIRKWWKFWVTND